MSKIRNNKTGEVIEVPREDLAKYGIKNPISPTPQPNVSNGGGGAGGGVSEIPSTLGMLLGSIGASPLGPFGRVIGAGAGAMGGDIISKEVGGLLGQVPPGESLTANLGNQLQGGTGQAKPGAGVKSVTDTFGKGLRASGSQLTGEGMAAIFHLLKPGVIEGSFNKLTEFFSKNAKGTIPTRNVIDRFWNESVPKAISKFGMEQPANAAPKVIGMADIPRPEVPLPASEMNYLRKVFNNLSKGMDDPVKHLLEGDLARILREEQTKIAPATSATIPMQQLAMQTPKLIGNIPIVGEFLKSAMDIGRGGVSGIGKVLSRYALPAFLKIATSERKTQE